MAKHAALPLLFLSLCLIEPGELLGQVVSGSIGMATIFEDDGEISSGGMTTSLEVDVSRSGWRWNAFAAIRGIGVNCSDGCDLGGQVVGAGVSRLRGPVGVGGGVAALRRTAGWYVQPFLQFALVHAPYQAQIRVELPQGAEGVHVPVLLGLRVPIG